LFKYISKGEFGKSEDHHITSNTSVFSILSFIGEFMIIFFVESDALEDQTRTVFSPFIDSSLISEAITIKVQAFFIISHFENVLIHWSCGTKVYNH